MKKIVSIFIAAMLIGTLALAQAPQAFNYQGIARNPSGGALSGTTLGLRLTILQGSSSGSVIYQETQRPTTNAYGLYWVSVGQGTVVSGSFNTINWGAGNYYLQVEMDTSGGTSYTNLGASELNTVPYAMFANMAGMANVANHADTSLFALVANRADTSMYAIHSRSSDSATYAIHAGHADSATFANSAANATHANRADTAMYAIHARGADSATYAVHADTAMYSILANLADTALYSIHAHSADTAMYANHAHSADTAMYANHAHSADTAMYAIHSHSSDTAGYAFHALNADTAAYAIHALRADTSVISWHAFHADTSIYAINAHYADSASYASGAGNAMHANMADTAQYALLANRADTANVYLGTLIMGGDVNGTTTAANVIKLQGNSISATAPTGNQVLQWNASTSAWTPATLVIPPGTVTSITASAPLTGGTITSSGSIGLSTVGTAATYGSSTQVPVITTDAYGRVTSASTTAVAMGLTTITTAAPLTGGTITSSGTIGLATVGTAATYGSATQVPVITTDAYGRVTGASTTPVAMGVTTITASAPLTGGTITGSGAIGLSTVGLAGTYGSTTQLPVITTDAYGRVTAVTTTPVTTATGATTITASAPLTGGTITTSGTIGLATVGTAATYGSSTQVPVITTDAYGRVTAATTATVTTGVVGTTNYIPKFTSGTAIGNSAIYQNGTNIGIGTTTAGFPFVATAADSIVANVVGNSTTPSTQGFGILDVDYTGSADKSIGVRATTLGALTGYQSIGVKGYGTMMGLNGIQASSYTGGGPIYSRGVEGDAYDDNTPIGIAGYSSNFAGTAGTSIGALGYGNGGTTNIGVYGFTSGTGTTNYAGYFIGDINVTGTIYAGTKDFRIDDPIDPENKYLIHTCVESNEMTTQYSGNVTTDASGVAVVELPAYFEALNKDCRYQLTTVESFARAMVSKKVSGNRFEIKTDAPNVEVSWMIVGVRNDAYAKAHPTVNEVEKEASAKGKYIHAVEYGKPNQSMIDTHNLMPVDGIKGNASATNAIGNNK